MAIPTASGNAMLTLARATAGDGGRRRATAGDGGPRRATAGHGVRADRGFSGSRARATHPGGESREPGRRRTQAQYVLINRRTLGMNARWHLADAAH
ncbi:hypothetical protein ACIGW8_35795 [Streptomyces sioyaensis]|uniref:hypothetical protein n=1 Tax=Streptomyces sioyaensis TaxID=67364 RepID=UPI0037CCE847